MSASPAAVPIRWRPAAVLRSSVSPRQACRALGLLFGAFGPLAACTAALWAGALLLYRADPLNARFTNPSFDPLVAAQVRRAGSMPVPDIVFLGDSSCLTGIHVPRLRALGLPAESLCTYAYTGPAGYALLLDRLLERGAAPKTVVLVFHYISLLREAAWDGSLDAVRPGAWPPDDAGLDARGLSRTLLYARRKWVERVLYTPAPGDWGRYYGSPEGVAAYIGRNHGSALDPRRGLGARSLEERPRREPADDDPAASKELPPAPTERFMSALDVMAQSAARLGRARMFLLFTPITDPWYSEAAAATYREAATRVADRLGIPREHILAAPDYLPRSYFSGATHLNRWGRLIYTGRLAELLIRLRNRD